MEHANKYLRTVKCNAGQVTNAGSNYLVKIDVYNVLTAFEVVNPAIAHAVKKLLCAGLRGYKDYNQDINEAIQSLERAKELNEE